MIRCDIGMIVSKVNAEPITPATVTHSAYAGGLSKTITYVNGLLYPIAVREADGFTVVIEPTPGMVTGDVKAIVSYPRGPSAEHLQKSLDRHDIMKDEVREKYSAFYNHTDKVKFLHRPGGNSRPLEMDSVPGNINGTVLYSLTWPGEMFEDRDKYVYVDELDVVIWRPDCCGDPMHPRSTEGMIEAHQQERNILTFPHTFNFNIEINDLQGIFSERYMNVNGLIFRIRPIKLSHRKEGIYVNRSKTVDAEGKGAIKDIVPLTEQNLLDLGLYPTYAEAKTLGDNQLKVLQRNAELEKEVANLKEEMARSKKDLQYKLTEEENRLKEMKLQSEREAAERQLERERYEHIMALERLRSKEEYEERSARRKDSGEILKIIPAIIVGIGAVFLALKNIFGKK